MKTIGIILCDNDFGNTFVPLLKAVREVLIYDPEINKAEVEEMIRKGIPFFYYAYQNRYDEVSEYLDGIKVMFDEELSLFIQENDHDGGSWVMDLSSGQINSF